MGLTTAEIVLNYVCPAMGGLMASVMFAGACESDVILL